LLEGRDDYTVAISGSSMTVSASAAYDFDGDGTDMPAVLSLTFNK
jgi:hypothetical protein